MTWLPGYLSTLQCHMPDVFKVVVGLPSWYSPRPILSLREAGTQNVINRIVEFAVKVPQLLFRPRATPTYTRSFIRVPSRNDHPKCYASSSAQSHANFQESVSTSIWKLMRPPVAFSPKAANALMCFNKMESSLCYWSSNVLL